MVVAAVIAGQPSSSNNSSNAVVPRAEAKPAYNPTPIFERVRLKTGANIRVAGSRTSALLRVATQGDVLTKFSEVNGWLQVGPVGAVVPEGWVAASTIGPNRQ